MAEVFLSRPNWIAPEYEDGLNNFLTHLSDAKLNPRTIGKTDHPIGGPLDAVIDLMRKCVGCVVLGYPQIEISQGRLKDKDLSAGSNLQLASEWNHIETSLAYMLKLPVLVIHHQDISRGIFDRGVCSLFLYSIDLKRRDWILDKGIRGAIESFKCAIDLHSKKEPEKSALPVHPEITEDEDLILIEISNTTEETGCSFTRIREKTQIEEVAIKKAIIRLKKRGFVELHDSIMHLFDRYDEEYYVLTKSGKDYISENKL